MLSEPEVLNRDYSTKYTEAYRGGSKTNINSNTTMAGSRRGFRLTGHSRMRRTTSRCPWGRSNGKRQLVSVPLTGNMRGQKVSKSTINKRRVIKMLFAVVLEFFICWTPLYVFNTWTLFNPTWVYSHTSPAVISYIQLLAYTSSCNNPITYCFMNQKFRMAFLMAFGCRRKSQGSRGSYDFEASMTTYGRRRGSLLNTCTTGKICKNLRCRV